MLEGTILPLYVKTKSAYNNQPRQMFKGTINFTIYATISCFSKAMRYYLGFSKQHPWAFGGC
jgi:hypothetical protein